jgi:hypothetical protein
MFRMLLYLPCYLTEPSVITTDGMTDMSTIMSYPCVFWQLSVRYFPRPKLQPITTERQVCDGEYYISVIRFTHIMTLSQTNGGKYRFNPNLYAVRQIY